METNFEMFDPNDLIVYSPHGSDAEEITCEEMIPPSFPGCTHQPPDVAEGSKRYPPAEFEDISDTEDQGMNSSQNSILTQNYVQLYQCKFCQAVAHSAEEFIKHFIQHFGNNRISYKEMTPDEVKTLDNLKEKFVCSICGNCFEAKEAVKEHMIEDHGCTEIKTNVKKPATEKVDDEFVDSQRIPLTDSSSEDEKVDNCDKKMIESDDAIKDYLKPMSLKKLKQKMFAVLIEKCPMNRCNFKFETTEKRDLHLKCHITTNDKKNSYKCFECALDCPKWRECVLHLWKEHKIDVHMMTCPICGLKFDITVKLYRHLQIHQPIKAYGCSYCTKTFSNQEQLYVHERLHQKKMKKTGIDDDSKDGDNENDEDGKLRWYSERKCDICGHIFSTSKILSKHIKTVHHKIKPFICNVCGYKSARKVTLNIHMRQHTGQKPLDCKMCSFRTADPSTLKNHEKRHLKETNYVCTICGFVAIQASSLKAHTRIKHPKEFELLKCDLCNFTSVNTDLLMRHKMDHRSGLIKSEDSRDSVSSKRSKHAPESSSDCFLPIESTDSVVHDAGGFTIPAVISAPVAHSEDTQFPT